MVFVPPLAVGKLRSWGVVKWPVPVRQSLHKYKGPEHSSRHLQVKNDGWQTIKVCSAIGNRYWFFLSRLCQSLYDVNQRCSRNGVRLTVQLSIRFLIANYCTRLSPNFKGLSRDGGRADFFYKPPRLSLNDDLSNEPNFGQIHLSGQYLT